MIEINGVVITKAHKEILNRIFIRVLGDIDAYKTTAEHEEIMALNDMIRLVSSMVK